jgi:hypothetical protein
VTGQFLSVDPDLAETGQPYTFTGDDPLNATDLLGLSIPGGPGVCPGPNAACAAKTGPPSSAAPALGSVPIQHSGTPVPIIASQTVTITVQANVTVSGPNPYADISFGTDGSVSFDNGIVSLSSEGAVAGVEGNGPCLFQSNQTRNIAAQPVPRRLTLDQIL